MSAPNAIQMYIMTKAASISEGGLAHLGIIFRCDYDGIEEPVLKGRGVAADEVDVGCEALDVVVGVDALDEESEALSAAFDGARSLLAAFGAVSFSGSWSCLTWPSNIAFG